jgi:hypothetical protein
MTPVQANRSRSHRPAAVAPVPVVVAAELVAVLALEPAVVVLVAPPSRPAARAAAVLRPARVAAVPQPAPGAAVVLRPVRAVPEAAQRQRRAVLDVPAWAVANAAAGKA